MVLRGYGKVVIEVVRLKKVGRGLVGKIELGFEG